MPFETRENWLKLRPSPSLPLTRLPAGGRAGCPAPGRLPWATLAAGSVAHGSSRPPHHPHGMGQELGTAPASPPRGGSACDFEGTVFSGPGTGASSQKLIVQDCQVRKYILDVSVFRRRLLFPLPMRGLLPLQKFQLTMLGKLQKLGQKKD